MIDAKGKVIWAYSWGSEPFLDNKSLLHVLAKSQGVTAKADVARRIHRRHPKNRVQGGCPGGVQGPPPLPAGGLSRRDTVGRSACPSADTVPYAPHQPAGIAKQAVWFEGVLNAGTTKGTPVVYHGSSWKCLRRQGVRPPGPRRPWNVGFEQWALCRRGRLPADGPSTMASGAPRSLPSPSGTGGADHARNGPRSHRPTPPTDRTP